MTKIKISCYLLVVVFLLGCNENTVYDIALTSEIGHYLTLGDDPEIEGKWKSDSDDILLIKSVIGAKSMKVIITNVCTKDRVALTGFSTVISRHKYLCYRDPGDNLIKIMYYKVAGDILTFYIGVDNEKAAKMIKDGLLSGEIKKNILFITPEEIARILYSKGPEAFWNFEKGYKVIFKKIT